MNTKELEEKKETAIAFKNVSSLLMLGIYPGKFSALVAQAVTFIDGIVKDIEGEVAQVEKKTESETSETVTENAE